MSESEQLTLPVEIRKEKEVWWLNAEQKPSLLRFLGKKTLKTVYPYDSQTGNVSFTSIDVSEISNLSDPDLRYALRFDEAARAAGQCIVHVAATDEGMDSRLITAWYSGDIRDGVDTFMEALHNCDPAHYYEDYQDNAAS